MSLFSKISHINLYSEQQPEMIAFYHDVLGMNALPDQGEDDTWYGFRAGDGLQFAIEPQSNRQDHTGFEYRKENPILIQFEAKDLEHFEQMNARLKEHNVKIVREAEQKSYGLITNFLDPDGNLLEILWENRD